MNQICAKIYYLIRTGEILVITSETQGSVEITNKEQDMGFYEQLKNKNIEDVDFIELKYGTLATTFKNVKSYIINLETKTLDFVYYTQEELEGQKKEVENSQIVKDRINNILSYINLYPTVISDLEKFILLREKNKTMGVIN